MESEHCIMEGKNHCCSKFGKAGQNGHTMDNPHLKTKDELADFMVTYHKVVKDLLEMPEMSDMKETKEWMAKVLDYNVPHGKKNRGLSTAMAYKLLAANNNTEENVQLANILGWCVEILQAFFLVADDIMDGSETRRGRLCWYKVENQGLCAVNDALFLNASIYQILKIYFEHKSYYVKLIEVIQDVTYKTIFGQSYDTRTEKAAGIENYTMERYSAIVKYKTSFYSFYLPVALAMTLAEINDSKVLDQVRKVTLEIGHLFQVQDDYLDCFGDVEVTGKIGTDIQDSKCSWMFVTALQRCNLEQKGKLLENYGQDDDEKIDNVKNLYKEIGVQDAFHAYEECTYKTIHKGIMDLSDNLPKCLFFDMLNQIYKRVK